MSGSPRHELIEVSGLGTLAELELIPPQKPCRNNPLGHCCTLPYWAADTLHETALPTPHGGSPLLLGPMARNGSPLTARSLRFRCKSRSCMAALRLASPSRKPCPKTSWGKEKPVHQPVCATESYSILIGERWISLPVRVHKLSPSHIFFLIIPIYQTLSYFFERRIILPSICMTGG